MLYILNTIYYHHMVSYILNTILYHHMILYIEKNVENILKTLFLLNYIVIKFNKLNIYIIFNKINERFH